MIRPKNMADMLIIAGAILAFFLLIFGVWFLSTWNRLISLEENINNSWVQISVVLKQRYDMIPNLVNIAKALVGIGPKVITCMPAETKPETIAGSSI